MISGRGRLEGVVILESGVGFVVGGGLLGEI